MYVAKEMKHLYNKNFKTLEKDIEEDARSWKGLPCSYWQNMFNTVKLTVPLTAR